VTREPEYMEDWGIREHRYTAIVKRRGDKSLPDLDGPSRE